MTISESELKRLNLLTEKIIGAAIEVHRIMGPGLLESIYEECLAIELSLRGLAYERQKQIRLCYKNHDVKDPLRIDFYVENEIVVEIKSVQTLASIFQAQTIGYLKLTNSKIGLLINFNVTVLKSGLKRLINPSVIY